MSHSFYRSKKYKLKQSTLTKRNWEEGLYNFLIQRDKRRCFRRGCNREFVALPSSPKKYCCQSCAAISNNSKRRWSEDVKKKIARSLRGRRNPHKGIIKVSRKRVICANPNCQREFFVERWKKAKFCGNRCAIRVIGSKPTSPKASKGKGGIRKDVSSSIYFYSRWEANIARLFTYLGIQWEYAPYSFDIGEHTYTPDFYLPERETFIEVKNFWWKYSKMRDEKFRELYPQINLEVILKEKYLKLEERYARKIPCWEYKNSAFKAGDT